MAQLLERYPEDVRFVYRHYPLTSIHDKAALAAQASDAAGAQEKFWEMHDEIFAGQTEWSQMSVDQFQEWLIGQAGELGLNVEEFTASMNSEANQAQARQAWEQGQAIGIPGTPFLLFNGMPYQGQSDPETLSGLIDTILLEQRQFDSCPPTEIDPSKKYEATIKTEKGDIVLELFADKAPLAVNSFIFLANQGWYDGITFHRVITDYIAQSGDPTNSGFGGPGYQFDNETASGLKFDQAGLLGTANSGANSNGSQFFITMSPIPQLDGLHTIFGRVISGMDVVQALTPRNPQENPNAPMGDKILDVIIKEVN